MKSAHEKQSESLYRSRFLPAIQWRNIDSIAQHKRRDIKKFFHAFCFLFVTRHVQQHARRFTKPIADLIPQPLCSSVLRSLPTLQTTERRPDNRLPQKPTDRQRRNGGK